MSLRRGAYGGIMSNNGQLVSGSAECGCCKCCHKFSGDEKIINNAFGGHFMELGSWELEITDSTIILGPDAGNFCGVKFNVDITITDVSGILDPCDTTATAELICHCDLCEDVFWEWNIEDCAPDYTGLPSGLWLGDGCEDMDCDNPNCSTCFEFNDLFVASALISDPDNSVRCRCPGDECSTEEEGEEF